jgi:hypothetical protein
VDEARVVLTRLERIERLDRAGAPAATLIAELRSLVTEAEAWVRVEPGPTDRAEGAIDRLRETLGEVPDAARSAGRTLLA